MTDAVGDAAAPPPTGFGIVLVEGAADNVVADNVVARTKEDAIRIFDFDPADPANPVPTRTVVRGNVVREAGVDGVRVDATTTDTVLERNRAFGAGDDGIEVDSASAVLTKNLAWFNHDLGIDAVPGVTPTAAGTAPAATATRRSAPRSPASRRRRRGVPRATPGSRSRRAQTVTASSSAVPQARWAPYGRNDCRPRDQERPRDPTRHGWASDRQSTSVIVSSAPASVSLETSTPPVLA